MDIIQEFGYICAVEELNAAIESYEPAMEGAVDTIKNIVKRFWDFVKRIVRQTINGLLSIIRKFRSVKAITINDKSELESIILKDVPDLMIMCENVRKAVEKGARSSSSDQMNNIANDLHEMHQHAVEIERDIFKRLEFNNNKDDRKTVIKTNQLNTIVNKLSGDVKRLESLENNARNNAVHAVNDIEEWTGESNGTDYQKEYVRMYNNAQGVYHTAMRGIITVINHINKL